MIKLEGFVVFVGEENRGRRRNERKREEGRSSCHKLNIIDGFTNKFNQHN